jgi:TPR repeat protein
MYRDGLGVRRNLDKALEYFQLAADAELADANVNLGKYYMGKVHPDLQVDVMKRLGQYCIFLLLLFCRC